MLREQEYVGLLIAAAQRSVKVAVQHRAGRLGLTARQFWFLNAARELPGASLGEIARRQRMDAPTASRIAEALARRGLVRTSPDDRDRRALRVLLTPAEVDAFRNSYVGEKSFRADYATMIRDMAATMATIMIELEEYKRKKNSAYLWKQHADSLKYMVEKAGKLIEEVKLTQALCERRGLAEKVKLLEACIVRLRSHMQEVGKNLQAAVS